MMVGAMREDSHVDPDAQATVTDFLDYTEHLPSDVERSLALLQKQDELYRDTTFDVHELLHAYGALPPAIVDPYDAQDLRSRLAYQLEMITNRRESSFAEAARLCEEVERHYNRLTSVKTKLLTLPQPPSRDPSPLRARQSPQLTRTRGDAPIRISLKVDKSRYQAATPRARHRRVTVPGEVLPPPNPESPTPSLESDWDEPLSPLPIPTARVGASHSRSEKPVRIKLSKVLKPSRLKSSKPSRKDRPPRLPGQMGTNVHSAVAGISTSNALSLLTPPPEDAKPGSKHAPWFRLTEYEMAKLRKRMKKNAIWSPSDTMIRRELVESGRGHDAYHKTKQRAEESEETFLDEDDVANYEKGRPLQPGEISADIKSKITNKGMSLNVQKKEKKAAQQQREAALQAQANADVAARNLGSLGLSFKTLFDRPSEFAEGHADKALSRPAKRKRDHSPQNEESQLQAQLHSDIAPSAQKLNGKKRRINQHLAHNTTITASTTSTTAHLAAPGGPKETRRIAAPSNRRLSLIIKPPAPEAAVGEPVSAASRTASQPLSSRASAGPTAEPSIREGLRRKSATPATTPTTMTAASRRSKRPAPGPVTSSHDGGAAVSVGKRKNAPRKGGTAAAASAARKAAEGDAKAREEAARIEEEAAEEDIDPNEPRYCYCGDVSYGTMVCCENPDCEREWFHLGCVGLQDVPARRAKWWCTDCDPSNPKKGARR